MLNKQQDLVEVQDAQDANEPATGNDGSDNVAKTAMELARKKLFEEMDRTDSRSRAALFNHGFSAGYAQAADDYHSSNIMLEMFAVAKETTDLLDCYALGFEAGYMRKLAEILVF